MARGGDDVRRSFRRGAVDRVYCRGDLGIVAGFSRYSSLSALSAVAISPLVTFIYYGPMPAAITALIAALVIWRHKDNIKRLMAGTEPKIGQKKEEKEQE